MKGYVYDASGTRVAKGPITKMSCDPTANGFETSGEESDYIHDQSGRPVTKTTMNSNGTMTWNYTNVYANGVLFATYDQQGLHFQLNDWLGTRRVTTDSAGVVEQTCASLPYGDQLNCTGSDDAPNEQHFTGKTHDDESGLDYFGARYYASSMGRWLSPDSINLTNARVLNPADTLNKYVYGADNPLKYVDMDGKDITVFYEPPLTSGSISGHILFEAENQQTGDAAVMSFAPASYSLGAQAQAVLGESMPSTDIADSGMTTNQLRHRFASLTIQTSPEEAQQVIDWIRAHPAAQNLYALYHQNCTTVCREALKIIGKLSQGNKNWTPIGLWDTIFSKYANSWWHNNFGWVGSTQGVDYGQQPAGYDPFNLLELLLNPQQDNSSVTTIQGPGTLCGSGTGMPCSH